MALFDTDSARPLFDLGSDDNAIAIRLAPGVDKEVVKAEIRFRAPARYDDELTLITRVTRSTHVRCDHAYELKRGETLLAEATTTIACVGRDGQVRQIPEFLVRPD